MIIFFCQMTTVLAEIKFNKGEDNDSVAKESVINMGNEIKFSSDKFVEPDSIYWSGNFWMWNGPLDKDVLLEQLCDMKEHDARSVCILPMPREFRPQSTNNQMDVEYLSPEFFQRVKIAVEEAKRLGMNYWLYDEGGWPSGEACGQVTSKYPEFQASVMRLKENGEWQIEKSGGVDKLNPKATQKYINLTHDGYKNAVGEYFGDTILFAFTDEPSAGTVSPGRQIPWTEGLGDDFEKQFGYRIEKYLNAFKKSPDELTPEDMRVRIDFFDCWSQRFTDAYFKEIQHWCHEQGILSSGHLGGEDETMGSVKYGYGHILRVLRAVDVPGVDVIWRQIFEGKSNHHFPLYAATAAHQIGSPYAFTESFCVYGNGLTLEQMKWVTDYQYVRGINLMVLGCYPLSTQDHLMCGERPHFGPINPLWDYIPSYNGYVARLGYALSCGQPKIETALYFPIRDMWATGIREKAVDGYESLVDALLQNQCGFDLIDDDVLSDKATQVEGGVCQVGPMAYRNIILGACSWVKESSIKKLAEFVRSGGQLSCMERLPETGGDENLLASLDESSKKRVHIFNSAEEIAKKIPALVKFDPPCSSIRVTARKSEKGSTYFLWNEGNKAFDGSAYFQESQSVSQLDPFTGKIWSLSESHKADGYMVLPLHLSPGESILLIFGEIKGEKHPVWEETETLDLTEGWQARAVRQYDIGEHDYEIRKIESQWESIKLGPWKEIFSEDFSGDVAYRISIPIKKEWHGFSLKLNLGLVEYEARVIVNGVSIGNVIGQPWEIDIPEKVEKESLELEIVVTNTLANILTSERVRNDWQNRTGPGWPGPYDARAAEFEKESRGGGLYGPVQLKIGCWKPSVK
jgi:hypothetical protein